MIYLIRYQYLVRKENLILFLLLLYRSIGEIIFLLLENEKL